MDHQYLHRHGLASLGGNLRCLKQGTLPLSRWRAGRRGHRLDELPGLGALTIGRVPWSPETEFDGDIDEVRIWSVARSQADIAAHIGHPLNGNKPNLLAYWKFDEGSGTNTVDATGHGYDGILVNGHPMGGFDPPLGQRPGIQWHESVMALPPGTWFSNDLTIEAWVYERS